MHSLILYDMFRQFFTIIRCNRTNINGKYTEVETSNSVYFSTHDTVIIPNDARKKNKTLCRI